MVEKRTDVERSEPHGLGSAGAWGLGIVLGLAVGMALGAGMDDLAVGIAIGLAIGVAFALSFGAKLTPAAARKRADERR